MTGERVMIVEDNERNIKLLRDLLGAHGYRTIEARSAEDAIALVPLDRPELVLMDIQLPGMDGVAALELRKLPETRAVPVIAVTAHDEGRPRTAARGGFRRVPREADRRPRPAGVRALAPRIDLRRSRSRKIRSLGQPRSWSSTTSRRTSGFSTRCSRRAAIGSCRRPRARRRWRRSRKSSRPRPPRRGHAGHGRVRSLSPPPRPACDAVSPGGDDHGARRSRRNPRRSNPAPTTSCSSRTIKWSSSRASARCCVSSSTTTRSRRKRRSSASGDRILERRVREQIEELERIRRLKRFLPPQVVDVVVSSGDESFLEGHAARSLSSSATCAASPFAETVEPEELMAVLRSTTRRSAT